jgi:enoyl-CoA hydratase/carnithine racemase
MSRRLNGHIASHLQRRARETAEPVAGNAPITLEVTKEAVRRIRRTNARSVGRITLTRSQGPRSAITGALPASA